jgi:hypothetical protein
MHSAGSMEPDRSAHHASKLYCMRYSVKWIEKSLENRRNWFTKNQPVKFKIFKHLNKFEIKNSKKLVSISIFLVQTEFKKFEVTHPTKLVEVKTLGKNTDRFHIRGQP